MTFVGPSNQLTVREHMTFDIAGRRYRYEARRVADIRDQLGMSETRFWQVLDALLDRPAAEAAHPTSVRRLRRLRAQRRALRSQRSA